VCRWRYLPATYILHIRQLTHKKDLSQPGEFLTNERVKIVTIKGEIANVAVLGPERKAVQVELSLTDTRALGIKAPVNLSGDLNGAADVILIGPKGSCRADGSAIVAKAHIHMTPKDARDFNVGDGDVVSVKLKSPRPITIDQCVIRVRENFALAMHIDFDEANAAQADGETYGIII
jgi:propanediol utilization protein